MGGPRVLPWAPSGESYGNPMGGLGCSLRPQCTLGDNPMEILWGAGVPTRPSLENPMEILWGA